MLTAVPTQSPAQADISFPATSYEQMDPASCIRVSPTPGEQVPHAWHLNRLNIDAVHKIATGEGVKIAVIDTAVATQGTVYFDSYSLHSYNFLPLTDDELKSGVDCSHGTVVASIIGADRGRDMRTNFAGIAPDSVIYGMRTISSKGPSEENSIAPVVAAMNAAIALDVDVINLSQTTIRDYPEMRAAVQQALDHGIVVVAASGNSDAVPEGAITYPAAYPGVISVGSTRPDDSPDVSSYIAVNQEVTIGAPGVNMTSLLPSFYGSMLGGEEVSALSQAYTGIYPTGDRGTYGAGVTGTSFAAPVVSGVVALLIQQQRDQVVEQNELAGNPPLTEAQIKAQDLTPAEIKQRLIETADPVVNVAPDPQVGWGVVNPMRALTGAAIPKDDLAADLGQIPTPVPRASKPVLDVTAVSIGLAVAGVAIIGSLLGLVARLSIPAARSRGGRPASPGESALENAQKKREDAENGK